MSEWKRRSHLHRLIEVVWRWSLEVKKMEELWNNDVHCVGLVTERWTWTLFRCSEIPAYLEWLNLSKELYPESKHLSPHLPLPCCPSAPSSGLLWWIPTWLLYAHLCPQLVSSQYSNQALKHNTDCVILCSKPSRWPQCYPSPKPLQWLTRLYSAWLTPHCLLLSSHSFFDP